MAIPRTLTRSALQSLHSSYLHTARSFQSYNFREYFVRLSERKFGDKELGAILPGQTTSSLFSSQSSQASSSSSSSGEGEDLLSSLSPEQKERLQSWWKSAESELESWKRASIVNNLFIAPKLVVEGQATITSAGGGGAGMEASAGGAGQTVHPSSNEHGEVEEDLSADRKREN